MYTCVHVNMSVSYTCKTYMYMYVSVHVQVHVHNANMHYSTGRYFQVDITSPPVYKCHSIFNKVITKLRQVQQKANYKTKTWVGNWQIAHLVWSVKGFVCVCARCQISPSSDVITNSVWQWRRQYWMLAQLRGTQRMCGNRGRYRGVQLASVRDVASWDCVVMMEL